MIFRWPFISMIFITLIASHLYCMTSESSSSSSSLSSSSGTDPLLGQTKSVTWWDRCCICCCNNVIPELEKETPEIVDDIIIAILNPSMSVAEIINLIRIAATIIGDLNTPSSTGQTALVAACASGNPDVVKTLLELKANPNIADNLGITPLAAAYASKDVAAVQHLLKYGADPRRAPVETQNS